MAHLDDLLTDGPLDPTAEPATPTPVDRTRPPALKVLTVPLPGTAHPPIDGLPAPVGTSEAFPQTWRPGAYLGLARDPVPPAPHGEERSLPPVTAQGAVVEPPAALDPACSAPLLPDLALDDLCAAPFTYLSGPAGTGKTWLARSIIQARSDALLCATTGIAAVNLGDAATINTTLGYFDTHSLWEAYTCGRLSARLRQLRKSGVRILVLDEVSMLEADALTVLCQAFDDVNLKKAYDQSLEQVEMVSDQELEMRLLLVGDFAQLPPVKGQFAFVSPEWARFAARTFKLDQIRRQGDVRFITALQAVRKGRAAEALQVLEASLVPTLDFAFEGTTIVAQNTEVDRINTLRHGQLAGALLRWPTVRSGEQEKDWLRLIPEAVELKVGALVMVLANLPFAREEKGAPATGYTYVNGDLGYVVGKAEQGIRVQLQRTGEEVLVLPYTSQTLVPTGKKTPKFEVKGTVTRMPLRLAYATTVHKSQGLSLDRVQVSIHNWMFTKPSMLYVALSRCRSLEGLRVVGNPKMFLNRCVVNPAIGAFL